MKHKKKQKFDLGHLFVPHKHNNYRPHAFRHRMLALYSFLLLSSQVLMGITYISGPSLVAENLTSIKENVVIMTNQERTKNASSPLKDNILLDKAAQAKMDDMFNKNYWDHISPDGKQAWDFIGSVNYKYSYAGENLARGFIDANSVVKAWMDSPSHRKNILNNNYRDIGIAVGQGKIDNKPTILIVQLFGSPQALVAANSTKEASLSSADKSKSMTTLNQSNIAIAERLPFFVFWLILFVLIIFDGLAVRKLGLHRSKKHLFQFRSALLINIFVLIILSINYVSIA